MICYGGKMLEVSPQLIHRNLREILLTTDFSLDHGDWCDASHLDYFNLSTVFHLNPVSGNDLSHLCYEWGVLLLEFLAFRINRSLTSRRGTRPRDQSHE